MSEIVIVRPVKFPADGVLFGSSPDVPRVPFVVRSPGNSSEITMTSPTINLCVFLVTYRKLCFGIL